jgi:hypothetical protein
MTRTFNRYGENASMEKTMVDGVCTVTKIKNTSDLRSPV